MTPESLLDAVHEVARVAGAEALKHFRQGVRAERKADGSDVSVADREAEAMARRWIEERFPTDGIIGEEMGETRADAKRRWILDPIDGTAAFVRGVPLWGTLVAVADGNTVLAGAIHCPAVGELACAALGEGCWWNGARAAVSTVSRIEDATVLTSTERFSAASGRQGDHWRALGARARLVRGWGDCYGYLLVATGRAEVMADPRLAPWDVAALMPVLTEAGGVLTDWTGRATAFGASAIATNAALATEVRALLGAQA